MPDEDHIAYAPTPYFVNYIAPTAVKVELAPVEVKPVKVPKKLDRSNFDARAYMLQNKYGLTKQDYQDMLISQEYKCAICLVTEEQLGKKLHVDHDHSTGAIRGLLPSL